MSAARTFHGLTRSQIMRRAWQLAKLNRTSFKVAPKASGHWQALAWKEARDGRTEYWTFLSSEHEARHIRDRLTQAEMSNGSDRFSDHSLSLVQALRRSLAELEAGARQVALGMTPSVGTRQRPPRAQPNHREEQKRWQHMRALAEGWGPRPARLATETC